MCATNGKRAVLLPTLRTLTRLSRLRVTRRIFSNGSRTWIKGSGGLPEAPMIPEEDILQNVVDLPAQPGVTEFDDGSAISW